MAEHRHLLLLILVVLRELRDFFRGGATGLVIFLGKLGKKNFGIERERNGEAQQAKRESASLRTPLAPD